MSTANVPILMSLGPGHFFQLEQGEEPQKAEGVPCVHFEIERLIRERDDRFIDRQIDR